LLENVNRTYNSITIEHLLPESYAANESDITMIGNIGNLILVDGPTNSSELRDLPFSDKKQVLVNKSYPLEKYILEQEKWEETQVRTRAQNLAEQVYYDFVNFSP